MAKGIGQKPTLPKQQLTILAICRFAEPVALTSVFPYLPEMIESFNVPTDQVAKWAGLTSAVFSLSQCLTAIAWGRASDRFGRKPIILIGLLCTMFTSILFGFSQSLAWALIVRSTQGLCNGNVGIIRTMVAELVPQKELQPRAFSIMPLVWTVGSILGPTIGGASVHPAERYPSLFGKSTFFRKFPFAPPNLLNAILFLTGIVTGFLFLHESLEQKKHRRDYGRMLGTALTYPCSKRRRQRRSAWGLNADDDEADPFLPRSNSMGSELSNTGGKSRPKPAAYKAPGWHEVFSRQSNINLLVYALLAMHSVGFDQLLAIFMHHPTQDIHSPDVHLPLKFSGGFGLDSGRIGLLFTIYGIYGMAIQFTVFPPLARKFGVLNCLKATVLVFPFIYLAVPFTSLLPTSALRQAAMLALMLVKGWCAIFVFPCITILLTNSAASLRILGTLNGVATSVSAIGRATGPALAGVAFTGGVEAGYVFISWWTLAAIAILGAVPVFWLVEMEGFGADEDSSSSDTEEDDDNDNDNASTKDIDTATTSATSSPTASRTAPMSIDARDESAIVDEAEEEQPDTVPNDLPVAGTSLSALSRVASSGRRVSGRTSFDLLHRVPSPIGLGPQGIVPHGARRYSSDLGATRSGFGAGGTSYH